MIIVAILFLLPFCDNKNLIEEGGTASVKMFR